MIIFNPSQVPAADGEYYAVIRVKSLNARATEVTAEHSAEIDTACTNAVGSDGQGGVSLILNFVGCNSGMNYKVVEYLGLLGSEFQRRYPGYITNVLAFGVRWELSPLWSLCQYTMAQGPSIQFAKASVAQLSESIGVEGIKRIVAVPSSSSSSAGAVAAAAPSTTERPRSASIGAGAAEDESGNSGRQRSGTDAAAAAAAAASPRRSSAAGGAGGDGGGGLDGGGGTKSILKIGSDSPRSGKGVSFARLSPGPGERPVIPSVAVLQPAKQLEFTGLAREPLQSELTITNVSPNPVIIKIKTTSPTNYRVRPNTVWCEKGESINVSIKRRDPSRLPFRDRFLVQVANAASFDISAAQQTPKEMGEFLSQIKKSKITEFRLHATYTGEDDDVFYEADQSVPSTPSGGDDGGKSFSRIGAGAGAGGDKSGNLQADASKVTSSIAVAKKADQVVVQRVEKIVMDPAKAMVILVFGIFLGMMLNESLSVNLLKMLLG